MATSNKLQYLEEEGRQHIYEISEKRRINQTGYRRTMTKVKLFAIDKNLLKSFIENINIVVVVQMVLAAFVTFACHFFGIYFELSATFFVSPLIFPLAFSINADFQRRETVLHNLADFKASSMIWFFAVRDFYKEAGLEENFMSNVSNKMKGLIIHLREYLLTEKAKHRIFISQVLYEDFSDIAQMTDDMGKHEATLPPPISRAHTHVGTMCTSFEHLRVVREYRSPRSIRSFTKIFIFILPILLSPYYVYLGHQSKSYYSPYVTAIIVSFLFGCLQGVQDKLDDPFDGMSEDDVNLSQLDDWTLQSLEATAKRIFKVGRFTVSNAEKKVEDTRSVQLFEGIIPNDLDSFSPMLTKRASIARPSIISRPHNWEKRLAVYAETDENLEQHPLADLLSNVPGDTTFLPNGDLRPLQISRPDLFKSQSSSDQLNNKGQYQNLDSREPKTAQEESPLQATPPTTSGKNPRKKLTKTSPIMPSFSCEEVPLLSCYSSPSITKRDGTALDNGGDAPIVNRKSPHTSVPNINGQPDDDNKSHRKHGSFEWSPNASTYISFSKND